MNVSIRLVARLLVIGASAGLGARPAVVQSTERLTVPVLVLRADGAAVTGLDASDFSVREGDRERRVASVDDGVPASLLLLLDTSASVSTHDGLGIAVDSTALRFGQPPGRRGADGGVLERAVRRGFVDLLRVADRADVRNLEDREPRGLTNDKATLLAVARRAIDVPDSRRYGPSPIWDATIDAIRILGAEPMPRALILWTDGEATGNVYSSTDARQAAIDAGVSIHVVSEATVRRALQSATTEITIDARHRLRDVAEATGGLYLEDTGRSRDPEPLFARIVSAAQRGYRVTFADDSGDARQLELNVTVREPGANVHAPRWVRRHGR